MKIRTVTDWFEIDDNRQLVAHPQSQCRSLVGLMMLGLIGGERTDYPLLRAPLPAELAEPR